MLLSWDDDVIFYSDGSNSGITITNISAQKNAPTISFDINFPDYKAMGLWEKQGSSLSAAGTAPSVAVTEDGGVYMAYTYMQGISYKVYVSKFEDGVWNRVGSEDRNGSDPVIRAVGNALYLFYVNLNEGKAYLEKYDNNSWSAVDEVTAGEAELNVCESGGELYVSCLSGSRSTLTVYKLTGNSLNAVGSISGSLLYSHALTVYNSAPVVSYFSFGGKDNATKLMRLENGAFKDMAPERGMNAAASELYAEGGKLYFLQKNSLNAPLLSVYNGEEWTSREVAPAAEYLDMAMTVDEGDVYIGLLNEGKAFVVYNNGGQWENLNGEIANNIGAFSELAVRGREIFAPLAYDLNVGGAAAMYKNTRPLAETSITIGSFDGQSASAVVSLKEGSGKAVIAFYKNGMLMEAHVEPVNAQLGHVTKTVSCTCGGTIIPDSVKGMLCGDGLSPLCDFDEMV